MHKVVLFLLAFFIVTGCGSDSSAKKSVKIDKNSKEYFGVIANATINIYELGGVKKRLFSGETTAGNSIEDIGNLDLRTLSFDANKFYLYEVLGGENWDIDEDGEVDTKSTPNGLLYRAVYKGTKSHVAWWSTQIKGNIQKISESIKVN